MAVKASKVGGEGDTRVPSILIKEPAQTYSDSLTVAPALGQQFKRYPQIYREELNYLASG